MLHNSKPLCILMLFRLLIIQHSVGSVSLAFTCIKWCSNKSPVLYWEDLSWTKCLWHMFLFIYALVVFLLDNAMALTCGSWAWFSGFLKKSLFKLVMRFLNRKKSCMSMIRLHARPNCSFTFLQFLLLWSQHTYWCTSLCIINRIPEFCKWTWCRFKVGSWLSSLE